MRKFLIFTLVLTLGLQMSLGSVVLAQDPDPTEEPTAELTEEPTAEPTEEPTAEPTEEPTAEPTEQPTPEPTEEPTAEPTEEPTAEPTEEPTAEPTEEPTAEPTEEPTAEPTEEPTAEPTEEPTAEPTEEPTAEPTEEPTPTPSGVGPAQATSASYGTDIYVQNPHADTTTYNFTFYPEHSAGGASISAAGGTLNAHGSAEHLIDNFTEIAATSWNGSALLNSGAQLAAAVLERSTDADLMLYTGYPSSVKATTFFAPSVVRNYGSAQMTSLISVQNAGSSPVNITVDYLASPGYSDVTGVTATNVQPGVAAYFDGGALPATGWLGAAAISADGDVIAGINTLYGTSDEAFSSSCLSSGANVVYLPTAMWDYASILGRTYIAVQNPDAANAVWAQAEFFNTAGVSVGTWGPTQIGARAKVSIRPGTDVAAITAGYLGSAVVRGYTSAAMTTAAPVMVVVNIVFASSTVVAGNSFTGVAGGAQNVALPFVTWASSGASSQIRSYLAVQNVGSAAANVTATFYNRDGSAQYTANSTTDYPTGVPVGSKVNFRPSLFTTGAWEGTVEVTSAQNVAALVSVQTVDTARQATYVGVPFTP